MNDPLFVCRLQGFSNLLGDREWSEGYWQEKDQLRYFGQFSTSAKVIYERGCQEKQLPDSRRSGHRCRGSQPLYRYK